MKLRNANLQVHVKNSFTYPHSCILPSKNAPPLLFLKGFLKCASKIPFRKYNQKVVLLVIYLFNCDSSKWTSFILNVEFDFVFSTIFVESIGIYCNTKITKTFFSQPVFRCVVLFDEKLIILHHGDNTFLFLFWHLYRKHFQQ